LTGVPPSRAVDVDVELFLFVKPSTLTAKVASAGAKVGMQAMEVVEEFLTKAKKFALDIKAKVT
jgi:hypothetical protein